MKNRNRRDFLIKAGTAAALLPFAGKSIAFDSPELASKLSFAAPQPPPPSCDYRLLRHAAAVFTYNDKTFLIDPYLNQAVSNVPLPVDSNELTEILNSVDAVLLTHAHTDHITDIPHPVLKIEISNPFRSKFNKSISSC